jgi:hypothetical protein
MSADDHLNDQQFAIDRLRAIAGNRKTIDVSSLQHLGLNSAEQGRLGSGSYHHTGESVTLHPDTPVSVRQGRVKVAGVEEYIKAPSADPVIVTDQAGGLHHLDGLHRMVAARLRGDDIEASVWRNKTKADPEPEFGA